MSSTITSKQADAPRFVSVTFNLKTYKPLDAFIFTLLVLIDVPFAMATQFVYH